MTATPPATMTAEPAPPAEHSIREALARALADPGRRPALLGSALCAALLMLLFRASLWDFYYAWTTDDNYSHGFLVPAISLYFAARIYQKGGPVEVRSGAVIGASLLGLAGLCGLIFGREALRRYWFPLGFLAFMVPLPIALYTQVASPLQLLASQAAAALLNATGVPVYRSGNHMTLPGGVQMFVAEACSGMRQLTGFLALAAAAAHACSRPWWYRATIVASALPIALFANVIRVTATGYIMHYVDPKFAQGAYHTVEGILLMGFGLFLLNSVCVLMDLILAASAPAPGGADDARDEAPAPAPHRPTAADAWGAPRLAGPLSLSPSKD